MVRTSGSGRRDPDLSAHAGDIKPSADATYDLGGTSLRWNYLYAVIAVLTSLTVGGIYVATTSGGWFFINETTMINGSLNLTGDLNVSGTANLNTTKIVGGNLLIDGLINLTTSGQCIYGADTGKICFNSTCVTVYDPTGATKVESCT